MKITKEQLFGLTHAQKRIWYGEKLYPELRDEIICLIIAFTVEICPDLLAEAVNALIRNNPDMRLRMHSQDGECMQYYSEYHGYQAEVLEFAGVEADRQAEQYFSDLYDQKFALYHCDLFHFSVLKINNSVRFFIKIHHLISDNCTIALIMDKVLGYYRTLKAGQKVLEPIGEQGRYRQYYQWEQEYLVSDKYSQNKEYWNNKFKTVPDELSIEPFKTLNRQDYSSAKSKFVMPVEFVDNIKRFCGKYDTTVYRVILAALYIYIYKASSREDIIISTLKHNRTEATMDILGMFVCTVPVRLAIDKEMDFLAVLRLLRKELRLCAKNQDYPYDQLINDLRENGVDNGNYLNDIQVSYHTAYPAEIDYATWYFKGGIANAIYFTISDWGDNGILDFEINYRTSLFDEAAINRIYRCMCRLIEEGIRYPEHKLAQLDMLGAEQTNKLLFEFNATTAAYPDQSTIHQQFEAQAERTPDLIAVIYKATALTYSQLNARTNQLARTLRKAGVNRDSIIALLLNRTEEMIIAILAILKAGGAYLPIDSSYPLDRISYMIKDSGAEIILTKTDMAGLSYAGKEIFIDDNVFYDADQSNLANINKSCDLAYMIYTSGSTGKPKGVMIEHRAVLNFVKGMTDRIDFHENKTILSLTTISFDIFVLEALLPLMTGMKTVIADETQQYDPVQMNSLIITNNVDIIQMTPSRMQLLLANGQNITGLKDIKEILLGGEAVTESLIRSLRPLTGAKLYNMYGPTETTVWSSVKSIEKNDEITIGKPIANTRIYIVNKHNELVPAGVIGEICIAGTGVARGYHNREELNREKFVKIPAGFSKDGGGHEIMYRTGDLGWWRPDGDIEFVGRIDTQVKLRGYRIELEEIERAAMEHGSITKCAAIVKENNKGHQYLVLYYAAGETIAAQELDRFLKDKLPHYMIPGDFIWMKELPMTPNGKLNRQALPESTLPAEPVSNTFIDPETRYEKQVLDIWKKVLDKDAIDIHENFFETGGNSFFLIMMHSLLDEKYPGKVKIADIFDHPTIYRLAAYIEKQADSIDKNGIIDKILTLKLPRKYFAEDKDGHEGGSLHVKLDSSLHNEIIGICRSNNIESEYFMLGMYLYLLAEVSQNDIVSVQAVSSDSASMRQINVNFADVSKLEALFCQVKDSCSPTGDGLKYKLENLNYLALIKEPNTILPVFSYNKEEVYIKRAMYDLMLSIKCTEDGMEFYVDSINNRINQRTMKALAAGYVDLLYAYVKQTKVKI